MDFTTFVGLDVHKDTVMVAVAREEGNKEPVPLGQIPKLLKRLVASHERLAFCYEAGPCGYKTYRFLKERGFYCSAFAGTNQSR